MTEKVLIRNDEYKVFEVQADLFEQNFFPDYKFYIHHTIAAFDNGKVIQDPCDYSITHDITGYTFVMREESVQAARIEFMNIINYYGVKRINEIIEEKINKIIEVKPDHE